MKKYDPLNAAIGKRIKEIRSKRSITQTKLAEMLNFSDKNHISNIERGYSGISVPKLMDLCKILNIDADYILFGVSKNNVETTLHKYLQQLTNEQVAYLMDIINTYIKSCGIDIEQDKK